MDETELAPTRGFLHSTSCIHHKRNIGTLWDHYISRHGSHDLAQSRNNPKMDTMERLCSQRVRTSTAAAQTRPQRRDWPCYVHGLPPARPRLACSRLGPAGCVDLAPARSPSQKGARAPRRGLTVARRLLPSAPCALRARLQRYRSRCGQRRPPARACGGRDTAAGGLCGRQAGRAEAALRQWCAAL